MRLSMDRWWRVVCVKMISNFRVVECARGVECGRVVECDSVVQSGV